MIARFRFSPKIPLENWLNFRQISIQSLPRIVLFCDFFLIFEKTAENNSEPGNTS